MTPERYHRIKNVLEKRQHDLTIVADEVHKQRNLSAMVRSCDAFGVDTIHSVVPTEGYQIFGGTAASAQHWVNVEFHATIQEPLSNLKKDGFQIVAANKSSRAIDYRKVDFCRPTAVVLGAEVLGISDITLAHVDTEIFIPMIGMVESFNVSVACALILAESYRQRDSKNMFDQCRLPRDLYRKRFFRWAHSQVAEFCEKHSIEYPDVDEDGEIVNGPEWISKINKSSTNN